MIPRPPSSPLLPSPVLFRSSGSLFDWHTPLPLQVSRLSQSVSVALPHEVPDGRFGCVHTPAPHTSLVQALPSLVHPVPSGSLFDWHTPLALQVSRLSQSVSE